MALVKSSHAAKPSVPKSSSLRPSPETAVVAFTIVQERFGITGPGQYQLTVQPSSRLRYSRTWSGTRTPSFAALRVRTLPVNNHSVLIKEVTANKNLAGSFKITGSEWQWNTRLQTTGYAEPAAPQHLALARNNAIRKLIDRAELGIEANLAQDFAQIGQTFGLITQNASKIVKSVRQLKRGNIAEAARILTAGRRVSKIRKGDPRPSKSLANNWLELQYGWKPLLMDIEGTLKSLSVMNTEGFVQTVTASGKAKSYSEVLLPAVNTSDTTGKARNSTLTETTCRIGLRFRMASPLRSFLAQTGFTNPINLVWEILPFSFVADWFLPIGPYLEAFSAFDGLEFMDGFQTQFTKGQTVSAIDNEQFGVTNPAFFKVEHGLFKADWVRLDRTKLLQFPMPTFPSFKNGFASVTHAANAISLIAATFR